MLPGIVDVTRITGAHVAGSPTSWQTANGPFNVEHVGATSAAGELLVFWWSPQHDWQVVNVTAITGQHVVGGVTSWQTPNGPFLVEHVAGCSPAGDLIVFWWSPQHDWQAVNVSAKTGRRIAGAPVCWVTPDGAGGKVEHLGVRGVNNELLVFFWTPAHDWQVVDVTAKTGRAVAGDVTAWQSTNGPMIVEHVGGVSTDGTLSVFWWSPAHDWQALNVSSIAGGAVNGRTVSWLAGGVEHVAAHGSSNQLFVYWWTPATNWRLVDVTAITGVSIAEVSAAYQVSETGANVELLSARGVDNALLRFWWRPNRDWQAQNLTLATGGSVSSGPTAWLTPSGSSLIEHAAAATPQQSLIVVWDDGESRRLTDAAGEPIAPLRRKQGRARIVAILWDPKRPTDPAPPVSAVEDVVFGAVNSARDYYLQVSGNSFTFDRAGVFGWFPASRPASYWWGPPDTNDTDHDGWVNPHVQKWTEAIRLADPQFDYSAFDGNPHDGHLRPEDELGVLIVIPQNDRSARIGASWPANFRTPCLSSSTASRFR